MRKRSRILWAPLAISAAALAAGLAGLALARDWKVLLAFPVCFTMTEISGVCMDRSLLPDAPDAHPGPAWAQAVLSAARPLLVFCMLGLSWSLIRHFSAVKAEGSWYHAGLYLGSALLPWGYRCRDAAGRLIRWTVFMLAFAAAVCLAVGNVWTCLLAYLLMAASLVLVPAGLRILRGKEAAR